MGALTRTLKTITERDTMSKRRKLPPRGKNGRFKKRK